MQLIQIPDSLILKSLESSESGMGYQCAVCCVQQGSEKNGFLLSGAYFLDKSVLPQRTNMGQSRPPPVMFSDVTVPEVIIPKPYPHNSVLRVHGVRQHLFQSSGQMSSMHPPFETRTVRGDIFYRLTAFKDDCASPHPSATDWQN
jgi:hypothetical protein